MKNTWLKALAHAFISQLGKFYKINFILGSHAAFFTASQFFSPLIGLWGGILASIITFLLRTGMTWYSLSFTIALVYHLPTLCGALYLASNSRALKIIYSLLAIAVFVTHPIGSQAYAYSFYWFIPALIALSNTQSIFLRTIGSTFATHAAGSIIWLYTHNLTPLDWKLLISVVWLERLILALGMTLLYYTVLFVRNKISTTKQVRAVTETAA